MLRVLPTLLAFTWIAISAMSTPADAAERLKQGNYNIVAERSSATLTVSGPIGRISATMPLRSGRINVVGGGQISDADAVLDAGNTRSKNNFVEKQMRGRTGLDVARFPTAEFSSTSASVSGDTLTVNGNLTVRGVTKPISLSGQIREAGGRRFVVDMKGRINRTDFGITAGRPLYGRQADVRLRLVARR